MSKMQILDAGIVGGCCGIGPAYIAELSQAFAAGADD